MGKTQAVKAISLLWIGSLLGAGCAFLTQVVLARQLGPADFGVFAAVLAMITLAAPMAGFGIAGFWLKAFGQEGWRAMRWLPGSFRFSALSTFTVIVLLVTWSVIGPNDPLTATILPVLTVYILGQVVLELIGGKLQLEERYINLAIWQLLPHLVRLLLVVVIAYASTLALSVQIAAFAYAGVALIFFIAGVVPLYQMYKGTFFLKGHTVRDEFHNEERVKIPGLLEVAAQAWPFGLSGIFYLIYFQSDIILLKYLTSAEAAGIYNVAFVVMAAVYLLPSVIYQKFLLPKLHRWAYQERERFYHSYHVGNMLMIALGSAAMLCLWVVGPWAIHILFGAEYQDAGFLLTILALAAPARFLATNVGATLVTQEHMRRKVTYMGAVAVLNIMLNLALIPTFGAKGAAAATVFSDLVLLLIYYRASKKYVFGAV